MDNRHKDIILFQTQRLFTVLCKSFLNILESLQIEHQIHFSKLRDALPPNYQSLITQADYFDKDKFSYLRKLVFDRGGECNRELQGEIDKYRLELIREKEKGQDKEGNT